MSRIVSIEDNVPMRSLIAEWLTAEALGAGRVVAKPFSRETLLEAVRSVIGPPIDRVA